MMTSILSPVEMDYDIAIIQDMEMVRGDAHSTDSPDICLYSQVCSRPPSQQDPRQGASKEGCHDERSLTAAGTVMTLLKTIEGQTRQYRSHVRLIVVYVLNASPSSNQFHLGLLSH